MRFRPNILTALLFLLATPYTHAQEAVPFRTRNLNPLVAIFGLPAWHVPQASFELTATTDIANHYRLSRRGPDTLIADAETIRTSLFAAKALNEDWSVTFELPYYRVYGGVLDDVIDAWHSVFSLPDGGRNNRGEDLVLFEMARNDETFFGLRERGTGIGDVQLGVNYVLGDFGIASVNVKLDTGDEALLAGSGSTDWSIRILRQREVALRNRQAGYYWGLGIVHIGDGLAATFGQRDSGYFGVLGGSWRIAPRLGLKAQLDMHSPLYRSQLEEIGERAWQGSIGGWWEFSDRGVLDIAFNEDLEVSTSPDIVVHLSGRWLW